MDEIFRRLWTRKIHHDTDDSDRLNYRTSRTILTVFAVVMIGKQYFGDPIQCWMPAHFTEAFEDYSESYCYVQNTYFVRPGQPIPENISDRKSGELGYYQWVPFALLLQAILFYVPQLVWSFLNKRNGAALSSLVTMSVNLSVKPIEERKTEIGTVAKYLVQAIQHHSAVKNSGRACTSVNKSRYLTTVYLLVKILYLLQILLQYVLIHHIIGAKSYFWGYEMIKNACEGKQWKQTGHFPRETVCDFEIREMGKISQRHTLQCALLTNMFNEKIYLFLWFYLIVVFAATSFSLLRWCYTLLLTSKRLEFVKECLSFTSDKPETVQMEHFTHKFLRTDGVFVLQLIRISCGHRVVIDLVESLWKIFQEDQTVNGKMDDASRTAVGDE